MSSPTLPSLSIDITGLSDTKLAETGGMTPLGDQPLFAEPDEVLTLYPVHVPWELQSSVESFMVNNSSFAAHSGTSVLHNMMSEGAKRYDEAVESGNYPDPTGVNGIGLNLLWNPDPAVRIRTLSKIVGPGLFTDALRASDAVYGDLFTRLRGVVFQGQPFTFADQMARKMPLHRHIKSGAAQTWR
ncbi:putative Insecticidal toxin protein [Pseudomonas syringae pv. tagetis]|nr:putative Insecticidal toxin protein [Pseudomonas syringae pv. tagetis]RMW18411.1 hypothetical protein ALO98_04464 [Pseudomonas syringae pv. tagetis]